MKDYLATYQEPDFLADEVCVYILSHILDVGIRVLTKSGVWTTTLADNMSNCEKYFAYCGLVYLYLLNTYSQVRKRF